MISNRYRFDIVRRARLRDATVGLLFFTNHDTIGVLHAADGFVMPGVSRRRGLGEDLVAAALVRRPRDDASRAGPHRVLNASVPHVFELLPR